MENIPVRHIDAPHKEPVLSGGFRIRNIKAILNGKDLKQSIHRHDFFFILILQRGKGNHEIDFVRHKLYDHQVFLMRPGQVHQLELKAICTGYLLEFAPDFYYPQDKKSNDILQKASRKNVCKMSFGGFQKLMTFLTTIFDEFTKKEERYQQAIQCTLSAFFIELLRQDQQNDNPLPAANEYTRERLDTFFHLLEKHIVQCKKASQYADLMSLSLYQLNSVTKSLLGKSCSELIDDHIILEAKRYLLATSNQVSQIAYSLGYEDVSYFVRYFKKHTGKSPEAFRNNFR